MKKLLLFLSSYLLIIVSFAQTRQTNVTDSSCFCCNGFYNLPIPKINGQHDIACDKPASYNIGRCEGATVVWRVTPNISFTGQGTSSITLTPTFNTPLITISVVVNCGRTSVRNQIQIKVLQPKNCDPSFLISTQEVSNTNYQITGIPSVQTTGSQHYWMLSQISDCSGNGTIAMTGWLLSYSAAGNVLQQSNPNITTAGPNNNGYKYPGLGKGQCYTLTHYILCCGQWKFMKKCFCMNNQLRTKTSGKDGAISEQKGDIDFKDLPKEVQESYNKKGSQ